ncbi:MAG: alpha/beta hydrolase [Bdellovibrionales bacterium]|nr:alpha/beta hydrolase [Bdellovibrionales bacterium]
MIKIPKETGTFKSFDGCEIYYEVRGEGQPLVLCYGIGCIMNHWQHQIRYFSKTHKVITFDYRAHHQSQIPTNPGLLTVEALAKDIKGLLDHLAIEKAGLWGHSFGAQVIVEAYDMFPERIHHLIFINGFVQDPLKGMFGNNLASSFFQLFKHGYSLLPDLLKKAWKMSVNNPLAIQLSALAGGFNLQLTHLKDVEIYARGLGALDLESFITLFEDMIAFDGRDILPRIQVPTLIIGGKKDYVTPQKHQMKLHRMIKGSDLLMVPYGSHCSQLDMPDLINLAIEKFLKSDGLTFEAHRIKGL